MIGAVKMLAQKGFGFITPEEGGDDVFFHASSLNDGLTFDDIKAGTRVSFDVISGERGLKAASVQVEPVAEVEAEVEAAE